MNVNGRAYSDFANQAAIQALDSLLASRSQPSAYQQSMTRLGRYLGEVASRKMSSPTRCLVASTAEDADYLARGVIDSLRSSQHDPLVAVFWNNHCAIPETSVAPIVHRYLQPGYETAESLIVVKSVISGSCNAVVRTNILALIESLRVRKIFIVSPVIHESAEGSLRSEFPESISSLFEFIYFAKDKIRDDKGEVKPGIGGQIYDLLVMKEQPVMTGYMPALVKSLASI